MIGWRFVAEDLLAECAALGIQLKPEGSRLIVEAPSDGRLTRELLERLQLHKPHVLRLMRLAAAPNALVESADAPSPAPGQPVCKCGSLSYRDVVIHDGQSIRRDCRQCGRFLDFPKWHGSEY